MHVVESSLWLADKTGPALVHSVFARSLNIQKDGELLTLQASDCPLVPMGARLERSCDFLERGFRPGQSVFLEKQRWLIDDCVFTFSSSRFVDLTLSPSPHEPNRERCLPAIGEIASFCRVQKRRAHSASLLSPELFNDATLVYLGDALNDLMHSTDDISRFCRAVSKLIGAGPGLTPSGDDILTGILFALAREAQAPGIGELLHTAIEAIRNSIHKTTPIATAFLHHATESRFSSHFLALGEALKNDRSPSLVPFLRPFAEFGHSSGIDSLVGIVCGLKVVVNITEEADRKL